MNVGIQLKERITLTTHVHVGTCTKADIACSFFPPIAHFSVPSKKHLSIDSPESAVFSPHYCHPQMYGEEKSHRKKSPPPQKSIGHFNRPPAVILVPQKSTRLRIRLKERCCQEKKSSISLASLRMGFIIRWKSTASLLGSLILNIWCWVSAFVYIFQTFFFGSDTRKVSRCFYVLDCDQCVSIKLNTKVGLVKGLCFVRDLKDLKIELLIVSLQKCSDKCSGACISP